MEINIKKFWQLKNIPASSILEYKILITITEHKN